MTITKKICKDGRIWGQSNKTPHLGILTEKQYIKKGWNPKSLGKQFQKGCFGEDAPHYGYKHTDETKTIISEKLKGKPLSIERRKNISIAHAGENNPAWKGGISSLNSRIRNLHEYLQWHSDVFQRDKWICQTCGIKGGNLHAHHIIPLNKILKENDIQHLWQAQICQELWNINNGITLCEKCHKLTNNSKREVLKSWQTRLV